MSTENFEKASRMKLRFETAKGQLTVEDLWDLPLTNSGNGRAFPGVDLDTIAVRLSRQIKAEDTESFVVQEKKATVMNQLGFDVVKHIIDVKLAEKAEAKARAEAKDKRERILEIIARKQDEALSGSSLEELQKMVESLQE